MCKKNILILCVIFIVFGILACFAPKIKSKVPISDETQEINFFVTSTTLTIGQKTIEIDLADTSALRTLGLSGRTALAPDHGMLFVFEKPDRYGFWMPEMNFSIDIIWIDTAKKIVHIEKNVSPDSYPKIFIPDVPAQFVLEVPAGFVAENKIRVGDEVKF